MSDTVFLNGELLPSDQAMVSAFDAGLSHATGLFETVRAYHGRVMRLDEHLHRMNDSAATLGLMLSVETREIEDAIRRLLQVNELADARIRIVVTPGRLPGPGATLTEMPTPTVLITAAPVQQHPESMYQQGMRVCICPYKQNRFDPTAGHKTLAYLPRLMGLKDAATRGCNEALWFTTENRLAEGCTSNVFIVDSGKVVTPPIETPILPGTVRKAVLELCDVEAIPSAEDVIDIDRLLAAQEVFITGSVTEVMPVTSIEKHVVANGKPGVITKQLREAYRTLVANECSLSEPRP